MKDPIEIEKADTKTYGTLQRAAEILDVKYQTIRNYVYNEKKIQLYRFMGVPLVKISDLEKLKKG